EDAVAEPVPADVRCRSAAGQRRGGPEVPALFVTQVTGFSARIAHWVVVPGREAELVGILAPRIGQSVLGNDGSKVRIRQHIHPGCRRHFPVSSRDDVLAPIRGESSQSVEEDQIATRQLRGSREFGTVGSGWHQARDSLLGKAATVDLVCPRDSLLDKAATVDLFRQRSTTVGDDGTRDRLEQNAVLVRYLLSPPQ